MSDDKKTEDGDLFLVRVAEWFVAIIGIVYAIGYLVVLTYLDTFGIHESAVDSLKLRYIHVGLLCIIPPAVGLAFFYAVVLLRRSASATEVEVKKTSDKPLPSSDGSPQSELAEAVARKMGDKAEGKLKKDSIASAPSLVGAILFLFILFVFYVTIVFLPTGVLREEISCLGLSFARAYWLLIFFLGTVLGMMVINDYAPLFRPTALSALLRAFTSADKETLERLTDGARERGAKRDSQLFKLLLGIIMALIGWKCLSGYWVHVGHVLWPSGIFYVLTTLAIILLNGIFFFRATKYPGSDGRRGLLASRVCLLGPLSVICVLSFARGVFPWIPTSKGGANFKTVPPAVLVCDDGVKPKLATELSSTNGVVVIEMNSEMVYLAGFDTYHAWESAHQANPFTNAVRPYVWSLDRKEILAIRYGRADSEGSD